MPDSTLAAIRTKVRRLTRSPSTSQMSDATLDEYINTFLMHDLPDQLRLFSLRSTLTFYTQPYQDVYQTLDAPTPTTDPLYHFKEKVLAIHPPVYLAGIQGFYTQHRDVFYGYYPQTNTIADTQLRGDGTTGPFTGTVTAHPILQNSLIFSCDSSILGTGTMVLVDYPTTNTQGTLIVPNDTTTLYGTINYVTGAYTFIFPQNTTIGATIWVENIAYQPGKPLAMLYYDNKFTIRPVPDKAYAIQLEVDVIPTELLSTVPTAHPFLERAFQYIAFGAAKKVFEDRLDYDSINLITPSLLEQENLLLRSTLTQQANERTVTLYTQGKTYGLGWFGDSGWPY